jgi:hypothetical protein
MVSLFDVSFVTFNDKGFELLGNYLHVTIYETTRGIGTLKFYTILGLLLLTQKGDMSPHRYYV